MTDLNLNNTYKNHTILIFLSLLYIILLLSFITGFYAITKNNIIKQIDSDLYKAANTANLILTENFFNKAVQSNSITDDEDYKNIIRLSEYCKLLNLKHLYSMTLVDNEFYYTSSSAADEELVGKTYTKYFDRYDGADCKIIFLKNIPIYEESKNKRGIFRSILIPKKTSNGTKYIIGADYSLKKLNALLFYNLIQSALLGFFLLLLIIPLLTVIYYYFKKQNALLRKRAFVDELTGLPNLQKMFLDIAGYKHPVFFLININSFKEINDLFGFDTGDDILKQIAKRIQFILVSDKYKLYKLLNDEFGILIDDEELTKENAEVVAKYIFDAVSDYTYIVNNTEINITIYLGIVISKLIESNLCTDKMQSVIAYADMASKLAKKKDKEFIVFDCTLNKSDEFKNNLEWSIKLKEALKNDKFTPFYQPIINNKTGRIEKYECLVRLIENDEIISPNQFIDISKKIKLYSVLTRIMLKKSFETFKDTGYEFSINISAYDIYDKETYSRILFLLEEYKKTSKNLVFEILESEGIDNYEVIKKFIDEVKIFKCKIAIDDFGTGYSNFEHILKLNVDYIKIDGSLIKNIDKNKNDYLITKSITDFAKALKIKTIAEYVHSKAVHKKILKLGIDYSQGFYFGKPSPNIHKESKI